MRPRILTDALYLNPTAVLLLGTVVVVCCRGRGFRGIELPEEDWKERGKQDKMESTGIDEDGFTLTACS